MSKLNQKGIAHIVILLVLVVGLIGSLYLIRHRTFLKPKADEIDVVAALRAQEAKVARIEDDAISDNLAKEFLRHNPQIFDQLVAEGLVENPDQIRTSMQSDDAEPKPSSPPPIHLSPTVSTCGEITSGGNYTLTQDLSSDQNTCIQIHDTNNVNLNCNGHSITSTQNIEVANVQNLTIRNCVLEGSNNGAYTVGALYIGDSHSGVIQNNTLRNIQLVFAATDNMQLTDNHLSDSFLTSYNSFGNHIINNSIINGPSTQIAVILLLHGHDNIISGNYINGGWDGVNHASNGDYAGADDGIVLEGESEDTISDNNILNNWDCGFETTDLIQNLRITNNHITNSGYCGIGAWHWSSWLNNIVDNNIVDRAPYLFVFFRTHAQSRPNFDPNEPIYFKNNQFTNNSFTNQTSQSYVGPTQQYSSFFDLLTMPSEVSPSVLQLGDNLFQNNDFGINIPGPLLIPASIFVDGGGNRCGTLDGSYYDVYHGLNLCGTLPSPVPSPSDRDPKESTEPTFQPTMKPTSEPTPTESSHPITCLPLQTFCAATNSCIFFLKDCYYKSPVNPPNYSIDDGH